MATTTLREESALLAKLVATASVSGQEQHCAAILVDHARALDLDARSTPHGVVVEVAGRATGRTLLYASHIDTVPAGEGWTVDPFEPTVVDGRLIGRGASDAKGPVAAMLYAAHDLARAGGPQRGRLLLIFGFGEETKETSMPRAIVDAGPLDAAVIGEPTSLDIACAQRGLVVAELTARGQQRHAAHDCLAENAIHRLAKALVRLDGLFQDREHPWLGRVTVTPTMLSGGVARNLSPPHAAALLDIRTTPAYSHAEVEDRLSRTLPCEVAICSSRLLPCETPHDSTLLPIARRIAAARCYGSPTSSDWVFLRHLDAIKCGPGDSTESHRPGESIALDQLAAGRRFYWRLATDYLQ
jgi:acetylornithine deacetylase